MRKLLSNAHHVQHDGALANPFQVISVIWPLQLTTPGSNLHHHHDDPINALPCLVIVTSTPIQMNPSLDLAMVHDPMTRASLGHHSTPGLPFLNGMSSVTISSISMARLVATSPVHQKQLPFLVLHQCNSSECSDSMLHHQGASINHRFTFCRFCVGCIIHIPLACASSPPAFKSFGAASSPSCDELW